MTSLSKSSLSSSSSRRMTSSGSTSSVPDGHDLAAGGNALPDIKVTEVNPGFEARNSLDQAVKDAASYAKKAGQKLEFSIEQRMNRHIVTVRDRETGDIVRQIPMEEMLALANLLADVQGPGEDTVLKGLFFDQDT